MKVFCEASEGEGTQTSYLFFTWIVVHKMQKSRFLISREIRKGGSKRKAVENADQQQLVNETVYIVEDAGDKDSFAVEEEDVFAYTTQSENNKDFANKSNDHSQIANTVNKKMVDILAKPPLSTQFNAGPLNTSVPDRSEICRRNKENVEVHRRALKDIRNKVKLVHPDIIKKNCGKLIPKSQIHPAIQREYLSERARKFHLYIYFKPSIEDEEVDILGLPEGDSDTELNEKMEEEEYERMTNEFLDKLDKSSAQETENKPSNVTSTMGLDSDEDALFIDENPVERKLEMDKSMDVEKSPDFKITYPNQNELTGGKVCPSGSDDEDVTFVSETKSLIKPTSPTTSPDQKKSPFSLLMRKKVFIDGHIKNFECVKNSSGQTIGRVLYKDEVLNARGFSNTAVSMKSSSEKSVIIRNRSQTDSLKDGLQPKNTFIKLADISSNVHIVPPTTQAGSRLSGPKTIYINKAAVPCSISDETHIKAKPQLTSSPDNESLGGRNTTPVLKLTQSFKCPHCPAAFSKVDALQAHKERDHRLINTLPNQSTHVSPNGPSIKLDNGKTVIRLESPFAQPELRANEAPSVGSLRKRPSDSLAEPSQASPQGISVASKSGFSVIPGDTSPGSVRSKVFVSLPELQRSGIKVLRPKLSGLRILKPKPPTLEEFVQDKVISVQNSTDPSSSSQPKIIKITPKGGGPPLKIVVPSGGKILKAPVRLIGKKYIVSKPSPFQSTSSITLSQIVDMYQLLTSMAPECVVCRSAVRHVIGFKEHARKHPVTDDKCLRCITNKKSYRTLRLHLQKHNNTDQMCEKPS